MSKRLPFLLAFLLAALFLWKIGSQQQQVSDLKRALHRAEAERDLAIRETHQAQKHLEAAIHEKEKAQSVSLPPPGDAPMEDALAPWLLKIQQLKDFLRKHPELNLPGMSGLTAQDWLNITAGDGPFTRELQLRQALAEARTKVRSKNTPALQEALKDYLAANQNQPPASTRALVAYLPSGTDPSVLDTMEINPSGTTSFSGGKNQGAYLRSPPLDPWDNDTSYSANSSSWGILNSTEQVTIQAAIDQATKANGAAPTDPSQIMNFPGISKISPDKLTLIFGALTNKP